MAIEPQIGKPNPQTPSVPVRVVTDIDDLMSRLRALDVRAGERLLAQLILDESAANGITYIGIAPENALAVDFTWAILRSKYDENGLLHSQALLQNVRWTDRTTSLYTGDGTRAFGTITYLDPTIPVSFNVFENDLYPEDYGWDPGKTATELLMGITSWVNGYFGVTATASVLDNVLTITVNAAGIAGNAYITYSGNPDGAITSGQFTGGTDPEV